MKALESNLSDASGLLNEIAAQISAELVGQRDAIEQHIWTTVFLASIPDAKTSKQIENTLRSWFNDTWEAPTPILSQLKEAWANKIFCLEEIGHLYELRMAQLEAHRRKDDGAYFTPSSLARSLTSQTLGPILADASTMTEILAVRVCDPASGAGSFALPVIDEITRRLRSVSESPLPEQEARVAVISNCVYFIDINPLTVAILRSMIWMYAGWDVRLLQRIPHSVRTADALASHTVATASTLFDTSEFNWASAFPEVFCNGGFSAIVGNPPWGSLRSTISAWTRKQENPLHSEWREYSGKRKSYAQRLKGDFGYSRQGRGDADVYRYFLERSTQLLSDSGRLGLVLPAALLRADGASPMRGYLLDGGTFNAIVEYTNTAKIFQIHSMFRFITVVWSRGPASGIERLSLGNTDITEPTADGIKVSRDYLSLVSGPRLSIPDIRSAREHALLRKLSSRHPLLEEFDSRTWNVRFTREVDMTKASDRFIRLSHAKIEGAYRRQDDTWVHPRWGVLLPLYEGRMVHQHDAFAKEHVSGTGRSAKWSWLRPEEKNVSPQYLVTESVRESLTLPTGYRAGFCDVTGHANERTVLAALLPPTAVAGNKVPTLRFDTPEEDLHFLWVAIANSFVIDWIARRRVATSLNYFQWAQIPFPRLDPQSSAGLELVAAARKLSIWRSDVPTYEQLKQRALIRARIDASVAVIFGLDPKDLVDIFGDFPLLDRGWGRRSSSQTRDAVLQQLGQLQGLGDISLSALGMTDDGRSDSVNARTSEDARCGRLAYVPGELVTMIRRSQTIDDIRTETMIRTIA